MPNKRLNLTDLDDTQKLLLMVHLYQNYEEEMDTLLNKFIHEINDIQLEAKFLFNSKKDKKDAP